MNFFHLVPGCYNLPDDEDQVRFYPREARLSNDNMTCINVPSQVLLIDALNDRLVIFCANVHIYIYSLSIADEANLSKFHFLFFFVRVFIIWNFYFYQWIIFTFLCTLITFLPRKNLVFCTLFFFSSRTASWLCSKGTKLYFWK